MLHTGTVLWFDTVKGFGFISQDDKSQKDIFVHFRNVNMVNNQRVELKQNQKVSYEIQEGQKGLNAVNVSQI